MEEQADAHIRTMDYLRKDMSDLRHSMETLSTELRGEMGALKTELRGEMGALRTELRGDMRALEGRFDRMETRFNWLIGTVITTTIANIGVIGGALWAVLQAVR